jgi:hypothetical protein
MTLSLITNYEHRIPSTECQQILKTKVNPEISEIKPQLVVGGIYLITGRILATVGDWGKNKMVKWEDAK